MKFHRNMFLALSLILMLCIYTVTSLKCIYCKKHRPDVECKPEKYCKARRFCFVQKLVLVGNGVQKVSQGCTKRCRERISFKEGKWLTTWCCQKDKCNSYK